MPAHDLAEEIVAPRPAERADKDLRHGELCGQQWFVILASKAGTNSAQYEIQIDSLNETHDRVRIGDGEDDI